MGMSSFYENLIAEKDEKVTELKAEIEQQCNTIEGLGQQNTELERELVRVGGVLTESVRTENLLQAELEQHKERYSRAIKMIENREKQLQLEKGARVRLAQKHTKLLVEISKLNASVRALKDVPVSELDEAIGTLANAIDTALLS